MPRRSLPIALVVVLATVTAAGCAGLPVPGRVNAVTHAEPEPPAPVAPLSAWQKLGATEAPPASVQRVSIGSLTVVNETAGVVDDDDARRWAGALLRTIAYDSWAVSRQQDRFLEQSGLSSAPAAVFGPDLGVIAQARQGNLHAEYRNKAIRRLVLRPVGNGLEKTFQGQGFKWTPYAFYLDAIGPAGITWTDAAGTRTWRQTLAAGAPGFELAGGELSRDPVMGEVWVVASDWDCTSPATRRGLAPLCNP